MKNGLVLEGGGLRCMYTAGILDVFMEHGVKFDGAIGVSAGATFGCNFKSGQIGRALRYNKRFAGDKNYTSVYSWLTTGDLVNARMAYHEVPVKYDPFDYEAFLKNPMEFQLVCTDVHTAQPVYKVVDDTDVHETLEWMRATASMPLVSRAVPRGDMLLLDGGISDSIPLRHFQECGYEKNVVILTQPAGFYKQKTKLTPVFKLFCKYPKIAEAMARRHEMYNGELAYLNEQVQQGNTLAIYPEGKLEIGRVEMKPAKMDAIYAQGRKKGEEIVHTVMEFLK